jgi:hypothetical protein
MKEDVMLPGDQESVAEPRPVTHGLRLRDLPEILASLPHLSPADLASFETDLEEATTRVSPLLLLETYS